MTTTKLSELAAVIKIDSLDQHLEALEVLKKLGYKIPPKCLDDEKNIFAANARGKVSYFLVLDPFTKNTYGTYNKYVRERVPAFYESIQIFKRAWLEPEVTPAIAERFASLAPDYNPFKMGSPYKELEHNIVPFDDSSSPTTATELLDSAKAVQEERGKEYDQGKEERNMGRVVEAFNAIHGTNLTEAQGWHFMSILKAVRLFSAEKFHLDSATDLVSYASLTGEAKSKEF